MNPTREQLELAAKAAGINIHHWIGDEPCVLISKPSDKYEQYKRWLPADDKSDSFDLMVACKIMLDLDTDNNCVFCVNRKTAGTRVFYADHNNDKSQAVRWAIFLCAVEIGRAM